MRRSSAAWTSRAPRRVRVSWSTRAPSAASRSGDPRPQMIQCSAEQRQVDERRADRPERPALPGQRPDGDLGDDQDGRDRGLDGETAAEARRSSPSPADGDVQADRDGEPDPHPRRPEELAVVGGQVPDRRGDEPEQRAQRDLRGQHGAGVEAQTPERAAGLAGGPLGQEVELVSAHRRSPARPSGGRSPTRPGHHPNRAARPGGRASGARRAERRAAGSAMPRTIVASSRTAAARPTPSCFVSTNVIVPNIGEHGDHDDRGARDRAGRRADALGRGRAGRAPGTARLADPLEDEDRVVHRQAEQDHEREQRHPVRHRSRIREVQQALGPVVLEDGDEDPVGGADRQQVEADHARGQRRRAEGRERAAAARARARRR